MKPAKFDYLRAGSVQQAVAAHDREEGDSIVLAGGQTLLPMLSMRLARPTLVVDIKDIDHCTRSPLSSHGQKGSGEGGAPAAIASAFNDALSPLG